MNLDIQDTVAQLRDQFHHIIDSRELANAVEKGKLKETLLNAGASQRAVKIAIDGLHSQIR